MERWLETLFTILQKILYLWIRSKSFPEVVFDKIDLNKPTCYILRYRSITDLLVLDYHCKKMGLPRPLQKIENLKKKQATVIYLGKSGLIQKKIMRLIPRGLQTLVDFEFKNKMDVQLVPISVFWGRNPGKEEKSLFKLLFFDDYQGGWLQRFFVFWFHGKQVCCQFAKPLSIPAIEIPGEIDETTKKLRRLLKIHFRKQRIAFLGPYIYDRNQVIETVLNSHPVQETIQKEAERKKTSQLKIEYKAQKYADEIAAQMSFQVVRFFDIVLSWLWKKVYEGVEISGAEHLRDLAERYEVVYVPCHRSHMDYLLVGYTLFQQGFLPPHTAAGVNLNFWPAGSLLRRGGAFFIRRSFKGDRLYSAIFAEYVHYLMQEGYPLCFYPEGGRSRTGKLLPPKTGFLSMVLSHQKREAKRDIAFVPVFIAYDRLMEGRSYLKELKGQAKKTESMSEFVKARKVLKTSWGKAYLNFGEPVIVSPTHASDIVETTAFRIMSNINASCVVSPVSLVGLLLLSQPSKAISVEDLLETLKSWISAFKACPYTNTLKILNESPEDILSYAETRSGVSRFEHPGGDVIFLPENESILFNYNRNNILHLFAVPSLIASFFNQDRDVPKDKLISGASLLYPFLQNDFFLPWTVEEFPKIAEMFIDSLIQGGLLFQEGDMVSRPNLIKKELPHLKHLGRVLGLTIERYAIFTCLLGSIPSHSISSKIFEGQCLLMTKRLSLLNGISDPEYADMTVYKNFIRQLHQKGYIVVREESIDVCDSIKSLSEHSLSLLHSDVRQSIEKLSLIHLS